MDLRESYDFEHLVNEAEELVLAELEKQLEAVNEREVCLCQDCVLDMAAFALNNIKPAYRVSLLGKLYTHAIEGTDYEKEIKKAVEKAIDRISKNPMHG
ncbi:MAG: late competence development ComFB family protein [Spirochaetota bacterium]